MIVLKKGSTGELVKRWQRFIGVKDDGIFGDGTHKATVAWQARNGLRADGKVGDNTISIAKTKGYELPKSLTPTRVKEITGAPSSKLVTMDVKAPNPKLNPKVVPFFNAMRKETFESSGIDFWSVVGDMFREASLRSNKDGVAFRSNHKAARAIDYDQNNKALVIVSELLNGKQYFRTYLICAKQDGTLGELKTLKDYRGHSVTKYVSDVTRIAEKHGFKRIPAWSGWQKNYNRREFWHYEKMDGLTWEQSMLEIS